MIYVYFKRRKEQGIFLPNFEIHDSEPEVEEENKRRVHALDNDECIHGAKFSFSEDLSYINASEYRIANIEGKAVEELLCSYTLPRFGK
jgi:hypothetical protein